MLDVLRSPVGQVVLLVTAALVMGLIGVYIVSKVRGGADDDQPVASELLSKFKEAHSQGGLSDEEYRTIKAKLAADLQQELRENEPTG